MNTKLSKVDVIAFGAHPDDVELGCSGTIAKLTNSATKVGIVDLTAGEMGSRGNKNIRKKEAMASAKVLGLSFRKCLNFSDGNITWSNSAEKKIIEIIRICKPKTILVPGKKDNHPDHFATMDLICRASYKSGFSKYPSTLPAFRPQRVLHYMLGEDFEPSFVVDISGFIETRRNAINCFSSQFFVDANIETKNLAKTKISTPLFMDKLETRIKYYGSKILKEYGEAFWMQEIAEIEDIATLSDNNSVF